VATRSDAGAKAFARRERGAGGLRYLQATRVYYVDLDAREGETQADLLARLDAFALAPSLIVETARGGGLHPYWVLEEPLDLSSEEAQQRYSNTVLGLPPGSPSLGSGSPTIGSTDLRSLRR